MEHELETGGREVGFRQDFARVLEVLQVLLALLKTLMPKAGKCPCWLCSPVGVEGAVAAFAWIE